MTIVVKLDSCTFYIKSEFDLAWTVSPPGPSCSICYEKKLIQCFFKLVCPSSCNWPNWHLQWVVGIVTLGVGLIFIIPSLFKRIRPQIITYIKQSKIRNIKGSTNTILTWQINFISTVVDPLKDLKWLIASWL